MIKSFDDFIENRCEEALLANKAYRDIQSEFNEAYKSNDIEKVNDLSMQMLIITESVCYKLAIKDVYTFLNEN